MLVPKIRGAALGRVFWDFPIINAVTYIAVALATFYAVVVIKILGNSDFKSSSTNIVVELFDNFTFRLR